MIIFSNKINLKKGTSYFLENKTIVPIEDMINRLNSIAENIGEHADESDD